MAQQKTIQITASKDFSLKYFPLRAEPVQLDISYINIPSDSTEANYTIKYKPKGSSRFTSKSPILLKSPIDLEAMRKELNEKLQIEGDTIVRAVSSNSIYELAYILDTIRLPVSERTIAGDFILNNYIKVFNEKEIPTHKDRQEQIQQLTQPLTTLNLQVDSLNAAIFTLEKNLSDKIKEISSLEGNLENIELEKKKIELEKASLTENANKSISDSSKIVETIKQRSKTILKQTNQFDSLETYQQLLFSVIKRLPSDSIVTSQTKATLDSISNLITQNMPNSIEIEKNPIRLDTVTIGAKLFKTIDKLRVILSELSLVVKNAMKDGKEKISSTENERRQLQYQLVLSNTQRSRALEAITSVDKRIAKVEAPIIEADIAALGNEKKDLNLRLAAIRKRLKVINDSIRSQTKKLDSASIFQINKLSVQIERGFIERIQVNIPTKYGDQYDIFENIFAIGFSSIKNFKKFANTKLVSRFSDDFIYLSDVIANYDNLLKGFTRDFSPADTTINHYDPKKGFIRLNQDQFTNLFDARVYTDIIGLKDNKPNGLVQIELARKFNILTSRRQIKTDRTDWGSITYLNVFGSLNKIENNNKYLYLRNENTANNGQLISPYYATNLDFRLYQSLSLGTEANLFLFDWPDGKLTSYLDVGICYGQTPLIFNRRTVTGNTVLQSERDSSLTAHSSTIYPKFILEVFSEKRIRLSMSYQYNTTRIFSNNNFKAIASYAKSDLTSRSTEYDARRSHMIEFNLIASPTSTKHGRFFLRARFFVQQSDQNTFFSQMQFGYSYNLRLRKFEL
ncbi:hypothetical protein [Dyadobacter luticola]|uniref:Uncharacterized protein n=1 Tax=Dyadobacter luticola TaxID=1979387 RepID=A0A5R9KZ06_9BACT|nr:hypothetical protein [Dyadobacter luticola]TLV01325.1 hypothetical protein FEN17_17980 [Dyadobacter luticola]